MLKGFSTFKHRVFLPKSYNYIVSYNSYRVQFCCCLHTDNKFMRIQKEKKGKNVQLLTDIQGCLWQNSPIVVTERLWMFVFKQGKC